MYAQTFPPIIFTRADQHTSDLCSGNPDTALTEDLWAEIDAVLSIANRGERITAIEDLTLMQLIERAAEKRAGREFEAGEIEC